MQKVESGDTAPSSMEFCTLFLIQSMKGCCRISVEAKNSQGSASMAAEAEPGTGEGRPPRLFNLIRLLNNIRTRHVRIVLVDPE
jgi:hypothetical protein